MGNKESKRVEQPVVAPKKEEKKDEPDQPNPKLHYRPAAGAPHHPQQFVDSLPKPEDGSKLTSIGIGVSQTNYNGTGYAGYQNYTLTYRTDDVFTGMPRYPINTPTKDLIEFATRNKKICRIVGLAAPTAIADKIQGLDDINTATFEHLEDYRKFFGRQIFDLFWKEIENDRLDVPEIGSKMHWRSDRYFALQQLSGINPAMIAVIADWDAANESLLLNEDEIKEIEDRLTCGKTLEELIAAKRLFISDYYKASFYNGVVVEEYAEPPENRANKRAVLHSPAVLFWANDDGNLMPLAIQINSGRSITEEQAKELPEADAKHFFEPQDNPSLPHVWYQPQVLLAPPSDTPDDAIPMDWLFARTCVMNTDGVLHEAITHLGFTHLAMETIIVGVEHCLPSKHGVYKLLNDHMFGTVAINTAARLTLIKQEPSNFFTRNTSASATTVHRMVQNFYQEDFSYDQMGLPDYLAKRGFEKPEGDSEPLANFFYRDYGYKVWDALETYVSSCVDSIYDSEEKLVEDTELAFLYRYLTEDQLEGQMGGAMKDVPEFHKSRDNLVKFLTIFIWTVSSQHAAVNFGQFAFYGFVPNRPLFLAKPFPDDGKVDEHYIIESLPNAAQSLAMILLGRVLSLPSDHPLMDMPGNIFGTLWELLKEKLNLEDNPFIHQHRALEKDFKAIEKEMEEQNKKFKENPLWETYPEYRWLLPSQIASSIAI